jgi:hypothetical protein
VSILLVFCKKVCFAAVVDRELIPNRENSYHGGSVSSIRRLTFILYNILGHVGYVQEFKLAEETWYRI